MAAGLKIVLPLSFSDTSLPILRDDKLLSVGSLVLYDPAHSSGPLASVPGSAANGSVTLRNIARKEAAALTGGAAANMDGALVIASANNAQSFKTELTGKGGIHGIVSQTNHNAQSQGARIDVATAIRDYLYANAAHQFYFSRWVRKTRLQTTTAVEVSARLAFNNNTTLGSNGLSSMTNLRITPTTNLGAVTEPGFNTLGNVFQAVSLAGFSGTAPASASQLSVYEAIWGTPIALASGVGFQNIQESWILYRTYIEDLTVSGRSYADVQAIDRALWAAAMASGGRYGDDTFTAPGSY